jgi:hypothetical protein
MEWCDGVCARAGARSGAVTAGLRKGRVLSGPAVVRGQTGELVEGRL